MCCGDGKRTPNLPTRVWLLIAGLEGPGTKPAAWNLVRALALVGFVLFAATTSLGWLHLNFSKPFANETIDLRSTHTIPPHIEHDFALLQRWLPLEGKVGYLSEKPALLRFELQQRLAPLLLDSDWRKHDLVLVDLPGPKDKALVESPSYQLVVDLTEAQSFAIGMRIYRRKP
jgi:hypothetical protein